MHVTVADVSCCPQLGRADVLKLVGDVNVGARRFSKAKVAFTAALQLYSRQGDAAMVQELNARCAPLAPSPERTSPRVLPVAAGLSATGAATPQHTSAPLLVRMSLPGGPCLDGPWLTHAPGIAPLTCGPCVLAPTAPSCRAGDRVSSTRLGACMQQGLSVQQWLGACRGWPWVSPAVSARHHHHGPFLPCTPAAEEHVPSNFACLRYSIVIIMSGHHCRKELCLPEALRGLETSVDVN